MNGKKSGFLSYCCEQREIARKITDSINKTKRLPVNIWLDLNRTPDCISKDFEKNVAQSDFVIILHSAGYNRSKICLRESRYLLSVADKPVLLIRLHPFCDVADSSTLLQWNSSQGADVNVLDLQLEPLSQNLDSTSTGALNGAIDKIVHRSNPGSGSIITAGSNGGSNNGIKRVTELVDFPYIKYEDFSWTVAQRDAQLAEAISQLLDRTQKTPAVLMLSGPSCIGKTTLVSRFFANHQTELPWLDCVIWIDCSKHQQKIDDDFFYKKEFENKLNPDGSCSSSPSSTVFVLDNVVDPSAIIASVETAVTHRCILIITALNESIWHVQPNSMTIPTSINVSLDPIAVENVVDILASNFNLRGKLADSQLFNLAQLTGGLALAVNLIGAEFSSTLNNNRGNCGDDRSSRLTTYCDLMRLQQPLLHNRTVRIVERILDGEESSLRRMFFAFLLFEPDEPVPIDDLAILWDCTRSLHQALAKCQHFARKFLLKPLNRDETSFCLPHRVVFEALSTYAVDHAFASSLPEARLLIATGHCYQLSSTETIEACRNKIITPMATTNPTTIMFTALIQQRWQLLARIVDCLDGDHLEQLMSQGDFCRNNSKNFVDLFREHQLAVGSENISEIQKILLAKINDRLKNFEISREIISDNYGDLATEKNEK